MIEADRENFVKGLPSLAVEGNYRGGATSESKHRPRENFGMNLHHLPSSIARNLLGVNIVSLHRLVSPHSQSKQVGRISSVAAI